MFLIDSSRSVGLGNYTLLLEFVSDTIKGLPQSGTQVGAALFSERIKHLFYLNTYNSLDQASSAVLAAPYLDHATNTVGALNYAHTVLLTPLRGDRPGVQSLVILFTDGVSNRDEQKTIPSAQQLHRNGTQVICIGITDGVNESELSQISSPPHIKGQNYLLVGEFVNLNSNINTLLSLISSWQTFSTTAGTATRHGRLKLFPYLLPLVGVPFYSIHM